MSEELDRLVAAVRVGAKYRGIAESLVRTIGAAELTKRRDFRAAVKETKGALHQAVGAYTDGLDRAEALAALRAAASEGEEAVRSCCRRLMARHASTRERLPILEAFAATVFPAGFRPRRVLDLACGLNPLSIPWLPLAPGCRYDAYDVDADLVALVDGALPLLGQRGGAHLVDLAREVPSQPADVALLLKCLPCLAQLDRTAPERLLVGLDTPLLIVSYPVRSLGGRSKGMVAAYDAQFQRLVDGRGWRVERLDFSTELVYRVHRGEPGAAHD